MHWKAKKKKKKSEGSENLEKKSIFENLLHKKILISIDSDSGPPNYVL